MKLPLNEIICISKYARNEKFRTKVASMTFMTFRQTRERLNVPLFTEDGSFNSTSQRVYQRTAIISFGHLCRFKLLRLNWRKNSKGNKKAVQKGVEI